jgi:hypothetical protein
LGLKLTVRNGTVIVPQGSFEADVECEDGRIAALVALGESSGGDEEMDATRLLVFSGFIDPHVHSRDTGLTEKEDFVHSTRAAAALEVARLLVESGGTRLPYRAVVFSAEEGARFGAPCIGSRVATGAFTAKTLRELTDNEGCTVAECASEVGLRPEDSAEAVWESGSVAAFLELHIEQGRELEDRVRSLGIVDAIAGSTRVELLFSGRPDHSGATPMPLRHDALTSASEFVLEAEQHALALRTTVATVGRLEVDPGSVTTVPGSVRLSLDVRDVDLERQRDLTENLLDDAMRIASRRGLGLSASLLSDQSPVVLHKPIRERLARSGGSRRAFLCFAERRQPRRGACGRDRPYRHGLRPELRGYKPVPGGVERCGGFSRGRQGTRLDPEGAR